MPSRKRNCTGGARCPEWRWRKCSLTAWPCTSAIEELTPGRVWALGRYRRDYPVFLVRGMGQRDAGHAVAPIYERMKAKRGIALTPYAVPPPSLLPTTLASIRFDEVMSWDDETVAIQREALDQLLEMAVKIEAYIQPIPVPAGFTWPQVTIEVISDTDVRIWTVGEPVVKSYADLGLANARDRQPNRLWKLLREFAAF